MQRMVVIFLIVFSCSCSDDRSPKFPGEQNLLSLMNLAREMKQSDADSAYSMARDIFQYSKAIGSDAGMAESSLLMGDILNEMGIISQANKFLSEANTFFKKTGQLDKSAYTDILISRVYQRSENYQQALDYLRQAEVKYQELADQKGLASVYADMGHVFEKTQNYDSALILQESVRTYARNTRDYSVMALAHENIGSIYEDQENYAEAFVHFSRAYQLNDSLKNRVAAIGNLNNLGDIYRKQGDFSNAINYTRKALNAASKAHQDYQVKSAYRDLAKIYQELNQPDSAFFYLDKCYMLNDELFSIEIAEEIARTQSIYELQQKQQRIDFLEKSEENNRLIAILSIGGIVLTILFGSIIFLQQRTKNRNARQLLETEAALTTQELENSQLREKNLQAELENKQLREDQLKQELELKSNSLTQSTLHMIQKNEFLQLMRGKLKTLKKVDDPDVKKVIKRIIRSIEINSHVDEDWKEFENVFAQVHSDFYVQLNQKFPDLSPSEVRLCAMIHLNMHSKDIATILGISQDSLRTARYRLRKKLGLDNGENLYTALIKIHD